MTSSKEKPQGASFSASFKQSINLDNVAEKVYEFANGPAPHLENTGILKDDGVTNLYATETNSTGTYDQVFFSPDGKRIGVNKTYGDVYVDDVITGAKLGSYGFERTAAPFNAIDMAVSTTGTWILLVPSRFPGSAGPAFQLIEYDPTTETVVSSTAAQSTGINYNAKSYLCMVKTHSMTLLNTSVVTYTVLSTTVWVRLQRQVAGVFTTYNVFSGVGKPQTFRGLSAFENGNTVFISGIPNNTSTPQGYYNTVVNVFTAWTAVTECSFGWQFRPLIYNSTNGVDVMCCPSKIASANHTTFMTVVSISTLGVVTVTTRTAAGLTIVPADTYNGFGFNTGRYKSVAATKFSPFICTGPGVYSADKTVTDYAVIPQAFGMCGVDTYALGVNTINGEPSHYTFSGDSWSASYDAPDGAALISEVGVVDPYRCPVTFRNLAQTVFYCGLPKNVNGQLLYDIVTATDSSTGNVYSMKPIAKNLLQFNDNYGVILNTDTLAFEQNMGAASNCFYSDIFLSGSNLLAWQTDTDYTNEVDIGIITGVAGITTTITSVCYGWMPWRTFYQVATAGTLLSKIRYSLTGSNGDANDYIPTNIAYVANSNLPAPFDATYRGGGVELKNSSALQTINESDADGFTQYYAGYNISNQYPVAYQFFNLFGQLYGFDGQKIYRMPVSGATAGTPEQLAIAQGLRFVVNSPTVAVFVSDFENALYIFTGGANVTKHLEMTGKALVTSGAYSVRENTLYLQLEDATVLTIRDDMAGSLANAYTDQTIYATDGGTYFVDNATPYKSTLWSYYAGTGTPLTLTWQSGYYGIGSNQYTRITQWVVTLKVTDPTTTDITVNYKWLADNTNGTETATYSAGTYSASNTGYVRLQFNPTQAIVYGCSFGVSCTKKAIVYDAVCYYTDGGVAPVVSANRMP